MLPLPAWGELDAPVRGVMQGYWRAQELRLQRTG